MPYDLARLFTSTEEESIEFRKKKVRTFNNSLAFTSFAAKYDSNLTNNSQGVYIFHVQGQVYHLFNSLFIRTHVFIFKIVIFIIICPRVS